MGARVRRVVLAMVALGLSATLGVTVAEATSGPTGHAEANTWCC